MTYQRALIALGNPTRCLIFERLHDGPASVGEIAKHVPVTRSAVSQHLVVLKEAGLADDWLIGKRHLYRVDERGLVELRVWLERFSGKTQGLPRTGVKRRAERRARKGRLS